MVACSGRHDFADNYMKVKILPAKKGSQYYEGYCELLEKAGPKPSTGPKLYKMPCTKRILNEIEKEPITRGELRKKLCAEGYKVSINFNCRIPVIRFVLCR